MHSLNSKLARWILVLSAAFTQLAAAHPGPPGHSHGNGSDSGLWASILPVVAIVATGIGVLSWLYLKWRDSDS